MAFCSVLFRVNFSLIKKSGVRYTSGFKYYQILTEPQPDDIKSVIGGIPIIKPPKPTLTEAVETRDPEEWKHVEALLGSEIVPDPPHHDTYPTPSGWVPPTQKANDSPYRVDRTRFHNFPIYRRSIKGGNQIFTTISKVQGNIWAMDEDVRQYISDKTGKKTYTKVDEVCCKIWVRGTHNESLAQFLIDKGF